MRETISHNLVFMGRVFPTFIKFTPLIMGGGGIAFVDFTANFTGKTGKTLCLEVPKEDIYPE